MTNAYVKLKQILPPAPVLVGLVTEHHDEDDTSTVVLPTNEGRIEYAAGVAVGSTIRPRGTTVPVGEKAFVRNGVIETRAPDGDPIEIEVGRVVPPPVALTFSGPIADQTGSEGAAFTLALAGYWSGGTAPLAFSLAAGTLPAGVTLSSAGVLSGTPGALSGGTYILTVRATDQAGYWADSNEFEFEVGAATASEPIFLLGEPDLLRSADGGVTWETLVPPSGWTSGYDLLKTPNHWVLSGQGDSPNWTTVARSKDLATWTKIAGTDVNGDIGAAFPPSFALALGPSRALGLNFTGSSTRQVIASDDNGLTWAGIGGVRGYCVRYHAGSGLFVATAGTGTGTGSISTSSNGVSWTSRHSVSSVVWGEMAQSGGTLIAAPVFETATPVLARSTDGVTWSSITPSIKPLGDVATDGLGGFIVATGSDLKILYSTDDGLTWAASAAFSGALEIGKITWTGSEYLAVVRTGLNTYTLHASLDGAVWALRSTLPVSQRPRRLLCDLDSGTPVSPTDPVSRDFAGAYDIETSAPAMDVWVAVSADGTNRVMTSPDGVTWTSRSAAAALTWTAVIWGADKFVAVGNDGTAVMTSPDGVTWTSRTGASGAWTAVAHGGGMFVAVASSGTFRIMSSPDGITWTGRTSPSSTTWNGVCYGGGKFVAVTLNTVDLTKRAAYSTDGINWTLGVTPNVANNWTKVAYSATLGMFAAVGTNGSSSNIMTSTDGINWTQRTNPLPGSGWSALSVRPDGGFAAHHSTSGVVLRSSDGVTWTTSSIGFGRTWRHAACNGSLIVVVGSSGTGTRVQTAPTDGTTWTNQTSAANNTWGGVAHSS